MTFRSVFLFILTCPALMAMAQNHTTQTVLLSPEQFQQKMQTEKGVLIDVRTSAEFKKGHLKGAVLIDIFRSDFETEINKLDKKTTYYVYCGVGGRSAEASELMAKKGFKKVYDLDGGLKRWTAQNLPVEQ